MARRPLRRRQAVRSVAISNCRQSEAISGTSDRPTCRLGSSGPGRRPRRPPRPGRRIPTCSVRLRSTSATCWKARSCSCSTPPRSRSRRATSRSSMAPITPGATARTQTLSSSCRSIPAWPRWRARHQPRRTVRFRPPPRDVREKFRRVVAGQDAQGRSCIIADGSAPNVFRRPTGTWFYEVWTVDDMPAPLLGKVDRGGAGRSIMHSPPARGANWRISFSPADVVPVHGTAPARRARGRYGYWRRYRAASGRQRHAPHAVGGLRHLPAGRP